VNQVFSYRPNNIHCTLLCLHSVKHIVSEANKPNQETAGCTVRWC